MISAARWAPRAAAKPLEKRRKTIREFCQAFTLKQSIQACSALGLLLLCAHVEPASAQSLSITQLLRALNSVHPVGEVAISPDGKHLVYGNVVSGKRDDAEIDVSAGTNADI
jgi:hypothetical protein